MLVGPTTPSGAIRNHNSSVSVAVSLGLVVIAAAFEASISNLCAPSSLAFSGVFKSPSCLPSCRMLPFRATVIQDHLLSLRSLKHLYARPFIFTLFPYEHVFRLWVGTVDMFERDFHNVLGFLSHSSVKFISSHVLCLHSIMKPQNVSTSYSINSCKNLI